MHIRTYLLRAYPALVEIRLGRDLLGVTRLMESNQKLSSTVEMK
jgi:hypothetical protein